MGQNIMEQDMEEVPSMGLEVDIMEEKSEAAIMEMDMEVVIMEKE